MLLILKLIICCTIITRAVGSDRPCAARAMAGESTVCVCHESYCDELTRLSPLKGTYTAYTTSKQGLRFQKNSGRLQPATTSGCCSVDLLIDPTSKYQTIKGFGGAVTDSAGINWKNLTKILQKQLINSYFSKSGLEYNMIRVPIGGSDFSTHPYAYNELPANDSKLSNFSLSPEDHLYKIPMIKECLQAANVPVDIVATTWSPPVWMKTNGAFSGWSRLKEEYFQTYADYHLKFLEKYAAEGVPVWAITTTNEPINGIVPIIKFNSLGWSPETMARWILQNLGPSLRNSIFNNTKILALDDQRYMIPFFFDKMVANNRSVLQFIDGLAVHYYGDYITPASVLSSFAEMYPDKYIIATEACEGSLPWVKRKVILGSWKRAENYIRDILEDLNHSVAGWIDWNLCLNPEGGPNWVQNYVDSPIIVTSPDEFVKQPMFYAMGHFTKFIPRGSQRILVVNKNWFTKVDHVAFKTPEGNIVAVLYNGGSAKNIRIKIGQYEIKLKLDASSVTTVELKL